MRAVFPGGCCAAVASTVVNGPSVSP